MPLPPIDLATIAAGTGGFVIHGEDSYDTASIPEYQSYEREADEVKIIGRVICATKRL